MQWHRFTITAVVCSTVVAVQALAIPHAPSSLAEWSVLIERLLCAALIPALFAHLGFRMPSWWRSLEKTPWRRAALPALLLVVLVLHVLIPPILLHVEWGGLKYLRISHDLSALFGHDGTMGQAGFLSQGLLGHLLGGGLRAFFLANTLFSVAAIAAGAALAGLWTSSRFAVPAVCIVLAGLNPIIVRSGASEDVHVVGAFYMLVALLLVELYAREGRSDDLVAAAVAAVLAASTRHIFLPMSIVVAILYFERIRPRLGRPGLKWAVTVLTVGVAARIGTYAAAFTGGDAGDDAQFGTGFRTLAMLTKVVWYAMVSAFGSHPLVDQRVVPVSVTILFFVGLYALTRGGRARRSVVLLWLWIFAATLPLAFGGIQVTYLFRIPLMHLTIPIAAVGFGILFRWIRTRFPARIDLVGFVVVALILPSVVTARTVWRDRIQDPFTKQVFFIERSAADLPEEFVLVRVSPEDLGIVGFFTGFPSFLLQRNGVDAVIVTVDEWIGGLDPELERLPAYLFQGVECHSMGVFEDEPTYSQWEESFTSGELRSATGVLLQAPTNDDVILRARHLCSDEPELTLRPKDLVLEIDPEGFPPCNLFYTKEPFLIGFRRLPPHPAIE